MRSLSNVLGMPEPGHSIGNKIDPFADACRLPVLIAIDASGAMAPYVETIRQGVRHMIEAFAQNHYAINRIDLEVITFNTNEQIRI